MLHIFQKAKVLLYYQVPLSEHLQDVNFCQFLPNPHENLDWSKYIHIPVLYAVPFP